MKNILSFSFIIIATISTAFATTNPEVGAEELVEIATNESTLFVNATFNSATDNLVFNTTDLIENVKIFNQAGEIVFELPVMSKKIQINKNLLSQGTNKLGFSMKEQSEIHYTQVTIR